MFLQLSKNETSTDQLIETAYFLFMNDDCQSELVHSRG